MVRWWLAKGKWDLGQLVSFERRHSQDLVQKLFLINDFHGVGTVRR